MMTTLKFALTGALLASTGLTAAWAQEAVPQISIYTRPQAAEPAEFQTVQLVAQEWRKLGLDVKVETMPWEQLLDNVWYDRENWDTTAWRMVARPERSDPDEVLYNMFNSSTMESGYNYVGYSSPEYDRISEAQRVETDATERQKLVYEAQEILAADMPAMMLAHPTVTQAFNKSIWDPETIVNANGIGIANYWTYTSMAPLGDVKDIVLSASNNVVAVSPLYYGGIVDNWVTELIYDRLVRIGPDGLPQPSAATSFEWVGDTTIQVTLRDGMQWSDGKPVTPEDVVYSFEAIQSGEAPYYTPFVANIDSIAADGNVITFTLKQPSASFVVASLGKINILPKHIWEPLIGALVGKAETAESVQEDIPVGSGPFTFARWLTNEEITLVANPDHFNAPKAERWILRMVPNAEATLGMLRSSQINFLGEFRGDQQMLGNLSEESDQIETVETVDMAFAYIAFNNRHAPFDDLAFRRALSAAINRNMIVQGAYRGNAVPSASPISPALEFWHNPKPKEGLQTGLDVAARILTDAGYTLEGGKLYYPAGQ
ncbi:ABC transporter substrate-binding protein [Frigidibacter mobilis]|uniref:Extracellular solute-binding protein family 5 n=1 Tax=Frigidibacter mobilis TaxID=1335048 RepID=A0A159Z3P4_9RHOB|nr:ABC transporter substrate-binding protein [Frigidibacter mobilis]AMY68868.1 extracellular solute-binding protein family 5 [Frigidibacter mobilis]